MLLSSESYLCGSEFIAFSKLHRVKLALSTESYRESVPKSSDFLILGSINQNTYVFLIVFLHFWIRKQVYSYIQAYPKTQN